MEREKGTSIIVIPYPLQGHINPMLQFSKRLASKGIRVTLVTTQSSVKSLKAEAEAECSVQVDIDTIPDPPDSCQKLESIDAYFDHLKAAVSRSLPDIIGQKDKLGYKTKFVIYDSILVWAFDVATEFGLEAAPFVTQPRFIFSIYYHLYEGTISIPVDAAEAEPTVSLPSLPPLGLDDLPSFFSVPGSYPALVNIVLQQYPIFRQVNCLFCNSFDMLEDEVVSWVASQWPVKNIGPTIPSMYLDKRLEDDKDYGLSLFKPEAETCRKWLDSKADASVAYVAFGSLAALREEQMEEIAWGLKKSEKHFLWVVRESELKKLPTKLMELEDTREKGLVVTWCPQLEVLAHRAVGCFVTHCGWNSTLEALSLGVPMVAIPQWSDQPTNAKFVKDVWRVGTRAKLDQKGMVTRQEIDLCIRQVMDGDTRLEIKSNSAKFKQLAKQAVDEGGTSDNNIEEFVAKLVRTTTTTT